MCVCVHGYLVVLSGCAQLDSVVTVVPVCMYMDVGGYVYDLRK